MTQKILVANEDQAKVGSRPRLQRVSSGSF